MADLLAVRDEYRAQQWAMLIQESKANGMDPYNYLFYTLSLLPYFGKSPAHEKLESLMPWHHEVQSRYGQADLSEIQ